MYRVLKKKMITASDLELKQILHNYVIILINLGTQKKTQFLMVNFFSSKIPTFLLSFSSKVPNQLIAFFY